jgi:hypothetical protein
MSVEGAFAPVRKGAPFARQRIETSGQRIPSARSWNGRPSGQRSELLGQPYLFFFMVEPEGCGGEYYSQRLVETSDKAHACHNRRLKSEGPPLWRIEGLPQLAAIP